MDMGQGITNKDNNHVLGVALEEGAEGALGLVGQGLGLVKYDDFGRSLAVGEKEALHPAFHEGVDFLAHGLKAALIGAVQEQEAGEFVALLAVEGDGETLGGRGFSGTWGAEEKHVAARGWVFYHHLENFWEFIWAEDNGHLWCWCGADLDLWGARARAGLGPKGSIAWRLCRQA